MATIRDHDPPTGNLMDTAAAINVGAGGLLMVYSGLIHHVIGGVLIALGLYLFYYVRTHKVPEHQAEG